jgi:hypothetical protein
MPISQAKGKGGGRIAPPDDALLRGEPTMRQVLRASCLATGLLLALASASRAGTVYVLLPGVSQVGSVSWSPAVSVANPASAAAQVKGVFIAADADPDRARQDADRAPGLQLPRPA